MNTALAQCIDQPSQQFNLNHMPVELLLVDDEEAVLNALRRVLRLPNYTIAVATSGQQALSMLEKKEFHIVISDMRMPGMSGSELLVKVANRWPRTVRIVLTGYADITDTQHVVREGHIFRYLCKPWDQTELRDTVKEAALLRFNVG